jgi:hypothetical protein
MILNPDFEDFFTSFNDNGVRYLVVGGYAVALHGHPRYNKDIDIWIERTPENAERIVRALEAFGFDSLGPSAEDFLMEDQIIQLGYPPHRIDLLTTLPGVEFDACCTSRCPSMTPWWCPSSGSTTFARPNENRGVSRI